MVRTHSRKTGKHPLYEIRRKRIRPVRLREFPLSDADHKNKKQAKWRKVEEIRDIYSIMQKFLDISVCKYEML